MIDFKLLFHFSMKFIIAPDGAPRSVASHLGRHQITIDPINQYMRRNVSQGGGGPRRGLTENFNMAKTNNLAIPEGGPDPLSPPPPLDLWIRPCNMMNFNQTLNGVRCNVVQTLSISSENYWTGLRRPDLL